MPPHQDDLGLQEAIKLTLVQLCKVGVVYQCELAIAGTVGVTVDRRRTILVHFDERLDPCQPDTSSVAPTPTMPRATAEVLSELATSSTSASSGGSGTSQPGAVSTASTNALSGLVGLASSPPQSSSLSGTYSDLAPFATAPGTNTKNEAYSQTLPTSIPIPIDIDSDSDSLCELGFDDDVIEVDPASMIRKKEVMWSGEDSSLEPGKNESKCGIKNIDHDRMLDTVDGRISTDDSEPTSSVLQSGSEDPPAPPSVTLESPPRLLVDKRLFLKKMSPYKAPATTRSTRGRSRAQSTGSSVDGGAMSLMGESGKPRLTCEVCGKSFVTHGMLEAHLVEAHGVVNSAAIGQIVHYTCRHCSKKFRYRATLDKHEFLHVADKPFKCQTCSNTYCYEESLQIHMNVHAGILDCQICEKMYSSRKHLQKHIVYMHEMRRVRSGSTPKKRHMSLLEQEEEDPSDKADPS